EHGGRHARGRPRGAGHEGALGGLRLALEPAVRALRRARGPRGARDRTPAAARPRLEDVRELVGEEPVALLRRGLVARNDDVAARGEGLDAEVPGEVARRRALVDADVAEALAEERLHAAADLGRERLARIASDPLRDRALDEGHGRHGRLVGRALERELE